MKNISNDKSFDRNTTLIIFIGNSIGIQKSHVINAFTILNNIVENGIKKIIFCSLPFSNLLSESKNKSIHYLNTLIYNLTCHSDILFFDCNKFITYFKLTQDTLYVSKKTLLNIAKLLAYNIYDPPDRVICSITRTPNDVYNTSHFLPESNKGGGFLD